MISVEIAVENADDCRAPCNGSRVVVTVGPWLETAHRGLACQCVECMGLPVAARGVPALGHGIRVVARCMPW